MIVKDYRKVDADTSYDTPGVGIRWVVGAGDGAPRFAMRVIEVEPGCATPHHQHWWEHEIFVLSGSGVVTGGDQELGRCLSLVTTRVDGLESEPTFRQSAEHWKLLARLLPRRTLYTN
jgi:hypothetical protein